MRLPLAILLFFFLQAPLLAKKKHLAPVNYPYQSGEILEYQAYYNWGFLWLDAARVYFSVRDSVINKNPVFLFESNGSSLKEYDWFFKVRNFYNSAADKETLAPVYFSRKTLEGESKAEEHYQFDQNLKKVYIASENSDQPFTLDTITADHTTYDLLTAIYFARTVDFNKMREGEKKPIKVISDGVIYDLYLRYRGKEDVVIHGTEQRYHCAKFSAMLIEGTVFNAGEDMTIWVTDDETHIPVQVEAKIAVGSVKAVLRSVTGNKYPLSSFVSGK